MAWTSDDVLKAAAEEWKYWGRSTAKVVDGNPTYHIGHTDDEKAYAQYVVDDYCWMLKEADRPSRIAISNDDFAWSAVGMSTFFKRAGATSEDFPFSASHSTYIRHFIGSRKEGDKKALYWGYRLNEEGGKPAVGDLVAYARGEGMTFERAQKVFDATKRYLSHADIVVAVRDKEIDVIGANVFDSVTKKTIPLGPNGHLGSNAYFPWFAVLKAQL